MKKEMNNEPVLEVKELSVAFSMYGKGIRKTKLEVLHKLTLSVHAGEILAVVGSSGSGKSILAHAIMGILPDNARTTGEIYYCGQQLTNERQKELRGKEIALIPQSVEYLDPLMKAGSQVRGVEGSRERRKEIFKRYQLDEQAEQKYPFQLSGGMARRILTATAVMGEPKLIIADEPTPGLNEGMVRETLSHFRQLADQGCAVLLITHDIDTALEVADRVAVFYAGTTVEVASAADFKKGAESLRHPYSKAFIEALPQNGFKPIPGAQPYAGELPEGCLFAGRCNRRTAGCKDEITMREVNGGEVRCIHAT